MKRYTNPDRATWPSLLARPALEAAGLESRVRDIMLTVKENGDAALLDFTQTFDKVSLSSVAVSDNEWEKAKDCSPALQAAIVQATENIRRFHATQLTPIEKTETFPGVTCWRKSVGIEKVGLYVPGGSAPLFSTLLMLGIPALLAGCAEIIVCTPPGSNGQVHPAVLFACQHLGLNKVFKVGGVQAIAALTHGTESIPAVHKIFGPGNQYVTAAKQLAQQAGVAIDMPAGPSEVLVWADESANPAFVAADLLSQAEHGPDSQVVLVSHSTAVLDAVDLALTQQLALLPRAATAALALENSKSICLDQADQILDLVNAYAPEHLILSLSDPLPWADRVRNAGSVFLGHYSPESVGDYASGTNHTLPTNGYARAYSGVSVDSFVKKITFQILSPAGLQGLGPTVIEMARAEGLEAHAQAVALRLTALDSLAPKP
ncbi:MAG: histidinol dehydrogenase [Sphingobacteriia bacterium]|nr:MAG: histidinol dehydrogenase [Sphingobacteriia bacterium]